jgi:ankyrin repeat protein
VYGVTPLSIACTNGNGAMVELLLKAGADPNTTLPGGETVLMTAARTGKVEAVNALITHGAAVNANEPRGGQTPLMWAAAEGNVGAVEGLLKAGADLHAQLDSGYTSLLFAVREGRTGVVRTLLKAGANVNEPLEAHKSGGPRPASGAGVPRAGITPLVWPYPMPISNWACYLLDAGADPNASGAGYTALHAISNVPKSGLGDNDPAPQGSGNVTSLEMVRKLVGHGSNINARMTKPIKFGLTGLNTMGATPFLLAAKTADAELMRLLACLGADPSIPNADNSTALMAAAGLGTRSPGEDAGTESEVVEAMQVALDLGADINAVDNNGETAMHGAAYKNSPKAVEFLAAKGAKIEIWDRKNKHGWTPLIIAEGHRFGNYKPSPVTVAALRRVMDSSASAKVQ